MTDRKLLLLKSHQCAEGLTDEELNEVADCAEIVEYDTGDYAHRVDQRVTAIQMIVQGRFQGTALDRRGQPVLNLVFTRGDVFGAVAAADGEPLSATVVAEEPSTVLQLDYQVVLELTKRIDALRMNFARAVARDVHSLIFGKKPRQRSAVIAIFHESPASRELTPRLVARLRELGETPSVRTVHIERRRLVWILSISQRPATGSRK